MEAGWGPLAETFFGLMTLRRRGRLPALENWRDRMHRAVEPHPAMALFDDGILDLFTLVGPAPSLEQGLESGARPEHMRRELNGAAELRERNQARRGGRTPTPTRPPLADPAHDRADRRELVRFLAEFHHQAVAPHRRRIHARLEAEHVTHSHTLATRGVEAMLAGLSPGFRWRPPILEIGSGAPHDVKLAGGGITLVPSVFCQTGPIP